MPVRGRSARAAKISTVLGDQYIDTLKGKILALRETISSGVASASYGDKRTEFRSLDELRLILNELEDELAALLGLGGETRQMRVITEWDKGL
jgi:hypothetical protein